MATAIFDVNKRWSEEYPELGVEPVPTEPCYSPAYYDLECERVFKRTWLYVGREEEIANAGDYFVRDMRSWGTSVIFIRGDDGRIRGFHNICSHRGNKLAWEETGRCKTFSCRFHGWVYDSRGRLTGVPDEELFHNFVKAENGLMPVRTGLWQGFIFASVDTSCDQSLTDYLGDFGKRLEGFPYATMKARYAYETEIKCNWKVALDAFSEAYHVNTIHGQSYPDTFTGKNNPLCHLPEVRFYGPHRSCIVYGNPDHRPSPAAKVAYRFGETVTKRSGTQNDLPEGVNPTHSSEFGFDLGVIFPNLILHVLPGMWFTHQFWPLAPDRTFWEGRAYWPVATTPGQRFAQEFNNTVLRNAWLEDTATMEATQEALSSGVKKYFHLQEQEILIRHSYKVLEDYVGFYGGEK